MKTSSVSFDQLRRLLVDLHFVENSADSYCRFEHKETDTVFLFRPYRTNENISMQDLVTTRNHLDWRGLMSAGAFDDLLTKAPA